MKILQLCSKVPFPPKDGGSVAMHLLTEGLIEAGADIKVLAISTNKHPVNTRELPKSYCSKTNFEAVFINTSIRPWEAIKNLFGSDSYNISRFYSPEMGKRLKAILTKNQFDVIQLETLFATPYLQIIRENSKAPVVLRSQNIEFRIWEHLAESETFFLKKTYLNFLARRLKKYETSILNHYDGIAAITRQDAEEMKLLGCHKPIAIIPFGMKLNATTSLENPETGSLFHLGAMDWRPNVEAVDWFLENVWNKILEKKIKCNLFLAGKNMPEKYLKMQLKNVQVPGEVKSAHEFIRSKSIMIVPLFSGSGIRVKIIEGMAMGKTIISTSLGAAGIDCENNKNILIADTPDEFVSAIEKCISDQSFCKRIGEEAIKLVKEKYDNRQIIKNLLSFYESLIH